MLLSEGYIYHIYNQGNNRQPIFFKRENYLFFLQKMKDHILPFGDFLAWCLMPNHFHWMIYVKRNEISEEEFDSFNQNNSRGATQSRTPTIISPISLNKSIGILLSSYTRAINKQNNTSGSIFRQKTKAECINCPNGIVPSFYTNKGVTQINFRIPERQYPVMCFHYIHQNPVKAGLAKEEIDWEFSSARDYMGMRNGKLVNRETAAACIHLDLPYNLQ